MQTGALIARLEHDPHFDQVSRTRFTRMTRDSLDVKLIDWRDPLLLTDHIGLADSVDALPRLQLEPAGSNRLPPD